MSVSLPPLSVFWNDTFRVVKNSWLRFLGVSLLGGVAFIIFALMLVMFLIGTSAVPASFLSGNVQNMNVASPSTALSIWGSLLFGVGGIISLIGILVFFFISMAIGAAMILIAEDGYANTKRSIGNILNQSFSRVIPLYLSGIATAILTFGGFGLLIIPGVILSFLFGFTSYEVVIGKLGAIQAMRESVRVVKSAFWAVVGRSLLLSVVLWLLNRVVQSLAKDSGIAPLLGSALYLLSTFISIAASFVLYRQAKIATKNAPKASLKPLVALSIVGYILSILFGVALIGLAMRASDLMNSSNQNSNGIMQQLENSQQRMQLENQYDLGVEPTSPEGEEVMKQLEEVQKQMMEVNPSPKAGTKTLPMR